MEIKEFKLVKNRYKPAFCYSYEKSNENKKYSIFTMDAGKTFLASIEEKRLDGKFYTEYSDTFNSVDHCIMTFNLRP